MIISSSSVSPYSSWRQGSQRNIVKNRSGLRDNTATVCPITCIIAYSVDLYMYIFTLFHVQSIWYGVGENRDFKTLSQNSKPFQSVPLCTVKVYLKKKNF